MLYASSCLVKGVSFPQQSVLKIQDVRIMKLFLIVALAFGFTEAGFRCTFGDWACSASCVTLGHTSGNCDPENECICSERRIDLDSFRNLVPSRCNLPFGRRVCKNTCRAVGYKEGNCVDTRYGKVNLDNLSRRSRIVLIFSYLQDCDCSGRLTLEEFGLCTVESVCTVHCQGIFNAKAYGECRGYNCVCLSNHPDSGEAEYLDFDAQQPQSLLRMTVIMSILFKKLNYFK